MTHFKDVQEFYKSIERTCGELEALGLHDESEHGAESRPHDAEQQCGGEHEDGGDADENGRPPWCLDPIPFHGLSRCPRPPATAVCSLERSRALHVSARRRPMVPLRRHVGQVRAVTGRRVARAGERRSTPSDLPVGTPLRLTGTQGREPRQGCRPLAVLRKAADARSAAVGRGVPA